MISVPSRTAARCDCLSTYEALANCSPACCRLRPSVISPNSVPTLWQVRLWDISYLRELRHMHERKGDDDDDDDEDEDEDEDEATAVAGRDEDEDEDEEEEVVAIQPRKKVKPLTAGRAAIKMTSDFFSDM